MRDTRFLFGRTILAPRTSHLAPCISKTLLKTLQISDVLAGGEQEGAYAEVSLAVLVDGLAGDGTLTDRLDIAHLARRL